MPKSKIDFSEGKSKGKWQKEWPKSEDGKTLEYGVWTLTKVYTGTPYPYISRQPSEFAEWYWSEVVLPPPLPTLEKPTVSAPVKEEKKVEIKDETKT